jgi:predicted ribosome-associated RNA-binding protein Tma20
MSFRYRYSGDSPCSIPALGLDVVQPGDVVTVEEEINHPDFVLVKDTTPKAVAADKSAAVKEG